MSTHLRIAARTDPGRERAMNEDALVVADLTRGKSSSDERWAGCIELGPRGALLAVADGVGGAAAGDVASHLVVDTLAHALVSPKPSGVSEQTQLTTAVKAAHETVWAEACQRGAKMGATLTAVLVRGETAYVAEVGDSRAYLLRAGQLTQLTRDQSYVQLLVDMGVIGQQEIADAPFRNIILQAMGHQRKLSIALGRLQLRHRDCLLLCSDGLTSELKDDEVTRIVLTSSDLSAAADSLVDRANQAGGHDNTTVVLAGVGGDLPPPSRQEPVESTYQILETFDH